MVREIKRQAQSRKEPARVDAAKHEAAHAVVSVRLGLPLASMDIMVRRGAIGSSGLISSFGCTTLVPGTAQDWIDTENHEALRSLAVQGAAGMAADRYGDRSWNDPGHDDDLHGIVRIAGFLGLGESSEDPAVQEFIADSYKRAADILIDSFDAWNRVISALLERRQLSGDDVRALVGGGADGEGVGDEGERPMGQLS